MKIRLIEEKDYEAYKKLFEEAFSESLEFLRREDPEHYHKERKEKRAVTHSRFGFYLRTGSTFVAEQARARFKLFRNKEAERTEKSERRRLSGHEVFASVNHFAVATRFMLVVGFNGCNVERLP